MSECVSSKDLRDSGVQAFHFTDEKNEAPKGLVTFPEQQGSLSAEVGKNRSSKPLAHTL